MCSRWARESDGRLLPFCRLDPAEDPLAESERCLAAGARGIKLHPRAQDFVFDGQEMDGVFSLAEDAGVPILIHAGRGLPPLAEGLVDLALRHPGAVLILAHGAICDQGILTSRLAEHPGVLYDISCFFPLDVIELFARVPAERIVFASDPLRHARDLPLPGAARGPAGRPRRGDDEGGARRHDGGAARRRRPAADRPPATRTLDHPLGPPRARVRLRQPGRSGAVHRRDRPGAGDARHGVAACRDPEPGSDGEALETIGAALSAADALLQDEDGLRAAIDLVYRAIVRAATEIPDRG